MALNKRTFLHTLLACILILLNISTLSSAQETKASLHKLLNLSGELTQGSAIIGKAPQGAKLSLNSKDIMLTPEGEFFIGFGRDAKLTQNLTLVLSSGEQLSEQLTLVKRTYRIQKIEGVPQKTVSPSTQYRERIQTENAQVYKARATISTQHAFLEKFIAPMKSPITGVYGSQRVYNGTPKRPHFGVDYAGPIGAPVYAPASGIVTLAHPDMFYSGGTLIIDHGYGVSSSFLHLSEIVVKSGQLVKQGDLIAKVGKGGRATGPHLDWRMNWFDVRIDPLKVIDIHKIN